MLRAPAAGDSAAGDLLGCRPLSLESLGPGRRTCRAAPRRLTAAPLGPSRQENVSLADILSLRDSGLSEQEAWAVCLECSLSMRSVAHAAIFQTLCITPDTLAFNTSGNVCFMEQLSGERGPGGWGPAQAREGQTGRAPAGSRTPASVFPPPLPRCRGG